MFEIIFYEDAKGFSMEIYGNCGHCPTDSCMRFMMVSRL